MVRSLAHLSMRRRILSVLTLACASLPLLAQAPDQLYTATRQQLDVTKVLLAQEAAWNKGDLDSYLSRFKDAPDTEALLNGSVRGTPNIRSAYHVSFPTRDSMGQLQQTEVNVRGLGETFALATGRYHLQRNRKAGGDTDGIFVEIFEKTPAGWQVVFSETT